MIFKNWLEHYLFTFKKSKVKKSTLNYYEWRLHELTPLYDIPLDELNLFDIQDFINGYSVGHSHSTVKGCFVLINQACKKAVSAGIIKRNPCDGVELPTFKKKDIDCLSEFELRQLFSCSNHAYYYPVFMFLLYSGMRVGELLALQATDIDFENNIINITKNFYRGEIQTPKTSQGVRSIPLTSELKKLLPGRFRTPDEIVFKNTLGYRIDYHVLLTSWHRQQTSAHFINCYGLHALRHTFASNLIHNGADVKTVSLLLGHKDIQTTLNFYCHSDIEEKRQVISKLNYNAF